jgi:hypothetical protein
MISKATLATVLLLGLAACSGARESEPGRTATEQLLFSVAAERAANQLALAMPPDTKVFIDAAYVEGTDSKYLVSSIRDRVLRHGAALVDNKAQADVVIEPRIGAISIDRDKTTLGTNKFNLPIPLAGNVQVPDIALYKRDTQQGVIKVAATTYHSKTGKLIQSLDPVYGFSNKTEWGALLLFSWDSNDLMPDGEKHEWVGE